MNGSEVHVAHPSSPSPRRESDVVFVGGGVVGLACAWRAAQRGLSVVVVDPEPGAGASSVAAGMLAPVTEAHFGEEALLRLNLEASRRYPSFVAELEAATGASTGYETAGTLVVARDADDVAVLEDLHRYQTGCGLSVERLRGRACRALEPALAPGIRGGLLVRGDHRIDPAALVAALVRACRRAGVTSVAARARAIVVDDSRVRGVLLADGEEIACARVVLCAGPWSGEIEGPPPEAVPPVRPVKGQLLVLRDPAGTPPARLTVRGLDVYVVPRADGRVIVGGTVEERGFDTTITAGAVLQLLRDACELLPALDELELVEARAGLRPGSPDNAPLVGETSVSGLAVATGHYRNGILLAPVTADAIASLLTSGEVGPVMAPFSPARLAAVGAAP